MRKSFLEFKILKELQQENIESSKPVGSKVSLGDGNEFSPFVISDDPKSENYGKNKNLAPIVRAFKQGANWGWSRDENTGSEKPVKITSKKLFLTGGAVRDHLLNKKPRNVELATSASPDEVYHLLKQNGFSFFNKLGDLKTLKDSPNVKKGNNQYFWVQRENKNGRPFVFSIKVNDDEYTLEVFTKTPKGLIDKDLESGTQKEDASGRDFTINGMYVLLNNDNGPNKDLYDFFGGMHHLAAGKINSIGDMEKKLEEDPSRILRYARMLTSYGDVSKVSDEEKQKVKKLSEKLKCLDRKYMMDEFKKGMDKEEIDSRKYLSTCNDLGILNHVFPNKILDANFPKEISELGDKQMALAYLLRMNDPKSLMDLEIDQRDLNKIVFLIKSLGLSGSIEADELSSLTNGFTTAGLPPRKLKDFVVKIGKVEPDLVDAFLNYTKQPRIKIFVYKDGESEVSDDFLDIYDPFTNNVDSTLADERKKQLELDSFQNQIRFMSKK